MAAKDIEDLLAAITLHNDKAAFKKLYVAYFNKLLCLAKSFVKSTEEAEEIVNDTFMNIWLRRADLPPIRDFTVYICTAVRNKSLTAMSKMKVYEHLHLDDMHIEIQDNAANGDDKIQADDLARLLHQAITKLPHQCRLVFKLVKEDGFKYKEVAELLNISVKTVEYHMGQALKKVWEGIAEVQNPAKKII